MRKNEILKDAMYGKYEKIIKVIYVCGGIIFQSHLCKIVEDEYSKQAVSSIVQVLKENNLVRTYIYYTNQVVVLSRYCIQKLKKGTTEYFTYTSRARLVSGFVNAIVLQKIQEKKQSGEKDIEKILIHVQKETNLLKKKDKSLLLTCKKDFAEKKKKYEAMLWDIEKNDIEIKERLAQIDYIVERFSKELKLQELKIKQMRTKNSDAEKQKINEEIKNLAIGTTTLADFRNRFIFVEKIDLELDRNIHKINITVAVADVMHHLTSASFARIIVEVYNYWKLFFIAENGSDYFNYEFSFRAYMPNVEKTKALQGKQKYIEDFLIEKGILNTANVNKVEFEVHNLNLTNSIFSGQAFFRKDTKRRIRTTEKDLEKAEKEFLAQL